MSRNNLHNNNFDEELVRSIEYYREDAQDSYESLLRSAERCEQAGNLRKAEDYRNAAIKYKEMLDNPSLLFQKAKLSLMSYQKRTSRKDNSPLSFCHRRLLPRTHPGWVRPQNKIRVPKLKRKTAWKRFYKIFPCFKGEDTLHKGDSLIKLNRYEYVPLGKRKRKRK